jgi:transposase
MSNEEIIKELEERANRLRGDKPEHWRHEYPAQRPTRTAERLAEVLAVRRQLSAEKVAAENASRLLEDAMLRRLSRRRIGRLAAELELLDERLIQIVATDAALAHRYRLLTSMPGVGPVLACTLIALLPELGGMTRKQVGALVGVAPYAFESSTLEGRRCIWGGRANVRQVLYMAAMSASNWNPGLKAFQDRLEAAGKNPKVTIVAVMRKMIITLAARSAGARSASLDATKSISDLPATR